MRFLFVINLILLASIIGALIANQNRAAAVCAIAAGAIAAVTVFRNSRRVAPETNEAESVKETTAPEPISARVLLAAMMSSSREGIVIVGEDLRVIGSNVTAAQIFAHVAAPLEGRRLVELTRNKSVHDAFEAAITNGTRSETKVETRGDDKSMFDLRVAPLHFADDQETPSAIGIFYDISQLERLEKVRQEFLSNVSHELRTPLTAILAFVETLEDGAINDHDNNLRFLTVIRKNAERMTRLINDILELSAIESGNINIEPANIKLHKFVNEIFANLHAKAESRRIELVNQVKTDVIVYADAVRLEQMLTNLIDNAIKFNRESGTVTVSHEAINNRDKITVTDTGEGVAPEHIERIFERFYRIDRARSREAGGTGLGLAIVKHLARLHNGEAGIASKFGEGATFTIELPKK